VQVILTIILIAAAAAWLLAVQQRLDRMRRDVKAAWKLLEPNRSSEAVRIVYNKHVAAYNAALETFPANILAPIAGFKPARPFIPDP
jgi:hypothetical protein